MAELPKEKLGHLADVFREAQSESSRHWSPMPSASGDGSLVRSSTRSVSTRGENMSGNLRRFRPFGGVWFSALGWSRPWSSRRVPRRALAWP